MFEYDPDKSAANLIKHGIDFDEAQAVWQDEGRIFASTYSAGEGRELVIGKIGEKLWTVVITMRGDAIRIISVRRSWDKEVKAYEREND